jgi:hypothetical protein
LDLNWRTQSNCEIFENVVSGFKVISFAGFRGLERQNEQAGLAGSSGAASLGAASWALTN